MITLQMLSSHLNNLEGYGESARCFRHALLENGCDVRLIDDGQDLPGLAKQNRRTGDPTLPMLYYTASHHRYRPQPRQLSIVRTMFESDRIPPFWVQRLNDADAVWLPSHFNVESFRRSGVIADRLAVIREPIESEFFTFREVFPLKTNRKFRFLSIFSGRTLFRKGADILLRAYLNTFTALDDVCLVVLCGLNKQQLLAELGIAPQPNQPEIETIETFVNQPELFALFNSVQAYVLPSRGEGIGRPYLYAMAKALPVIATGWSGNVEFMHERNSFLVKCSLRPAPHDVRRMIYPLYFGTQLAEPDMQHLQELLAYVFSHTRETARIGAEAQRTMREYHSAAAVAEQVAAWWAQLPSARSRRNRQTLYSHLLPLAFPGIDGDFLAAHRAFCRLRLRHIGIYGTGSAACAAYGWVKRMAPQARITFFDRPGKRQRFLRRRLLPIEAWASSQVQMVLIAADRRFLADIMDRIAPLVIRPIYYYY